EHAGFAWPGDQGRGAADRQPPLHTAFGAWRLTRRGGDQGPRRNLRPCGAGAVVQQSNRKPLASSAIDPPSGPNRISNGPSLIARLRLCQSSQLSTVIGCPFSSSQVTSASVRNAVCRSTG